MHRMVLAFLAVLFFFPLPELSESSSSAEPTDATHEESTAPSVDSDSPTLASYRRALELTEEALTAMGGLDALREAGGISLVGRGTLDLTTQMQGSHPDRPDLVPVEEWLAVDLKGDRVAYETHAAVNPDADEWVRYIHDGEGRMLVVLRLSNQAFWVPGDPDQKRRYERVVPQLLLRDALRRRESLRHLGRWQSEEHVAFSLQSGQSVTLSIDADTRLLRGFEYLLDLPLQGDVAIRWSFQDYRPVAGVGLYPFGYEIHRGDRLYKHVRYERVEAGAEQAEVFRAPAGIDIPEPPEATPSTGQTDPMADEGEPPLPDVRTLAEGVYLAVSVRNGFHVLFVELEEGVLVVDAPAGYHELQMVPAKDWAGASDSGAVGRRLLAAVRATVPGRPIRYLVLTHHHGDHAGGLRPFLAEGVTVLASPVTAPVVERTAERHFTLGPEELPGRTSSPRIEVVRGELTVGEGERKVRVIDVGANPHADGMLVVYLPLERLLYQSDLFMPSGADFPDPARVPVMRWFVDWLDQSGLEAERLYAVHGSARVTEEQLSIIRQWD